KRSASKPSQGHKVVATNRRAFHDYFIEDRIEAGLVLRGTEIKSIREGRVNLRDAYARVDRGEAWLVNAHIAPYLQGSWTNHEPLRDRKLLLHKSQIAALARQASQRGQTIIPLQLYLKDGRAKVELAVAHGKREYDKREAIARRDAEREIERGVRSRSRES
ncbi:MAG TPA: SsrA-binding protein SmpB, partial [Chloroflexota bacterium]|nr:SsrA-binding protein SmpB [Chloroflexota bacterium]